jgi:hypothetical protein
VQRPLTSRPTGWPAGQLLSRFEPKLLGHVFTREGKGYVGEESWWRPNSLAGRLPHGELLPRPSRWSSLMAL